MLVQQAIDLLRSQPTLSRDDQRDLEDALELHARL